MVNMEIEKRRMIEDRIISAMKRNRFGTIPEAEILRMAKDTVKNLDFNNSYQMHKSPEGYADMLALDYFYNKK